MNQKRVGILRGGKEGNYASSLKKGGEIISFISEKLGDKYKTFDIFVDKDGAWHLNGRQIVPADLPAKIDVVWNTAHSGMSVTLNDFSIPNIGGGYFLENSREMLREHMNKIDVPMTRSILLPLYQEDFDGPRERYAIKKAKEVFEKFSSPWIVKSFTPDKNMGMHLAKTFNELVSSIEDGVIHGQSIIVEEFIPGKIASVHSILGFRSDLPAQAGEIYNLPILNSFSEFSPSEKENLFALAKKLYKHIGAQHYLKSDFILNPKGKIYLLGIDSMPDLKEGSHFMQSCEAIGIEPHNIVEHIIERA